MGDMGNAPYTQRSASLLLAVEMLLEAPNTLPPGAFELLRNALSDGLDARLLKAWRRSELDLGELIAKTAGAPADDFLLCDDDTLVRYLEVEVAEMPK